MNAQTNTRAVFVTGTDTEVGKSLVSAALLHWCTAQGWRSAGYKPVAAGTTPGPHGPSNEDVELLHAASSLPLSPQEVCPWLLGEACSPHIAARLEGRTITLDTIVAGAQALASCADALVVEGAGGFVVPLSDTLDTADIACALQWPVVLVTGLRLGCINHTLLTAEAITRRGLKLAGWVGNAIDPHMPWRGDNIDYLRQRLHRQFGAPCLGLIPWLASPDPAAAVPYLDGAELASVFNATSH